MQKVLSVRQPWAWLIANGYKGLENRSWNTNFRGDFYIQASQFFSNKEWQAAITLMHKRGIDKKIIKHMMDSKYEIMASCGGIVGQATLAHVVPARDTRYLTHKDAVWYMGKVAWILQNQKALPFTPLKGRLGFFDLPDSVKF